MPEGTHETQAGGEATATFSGDPEAQPPHEAASLGPGATIGRYRVVDTLGRGAMGVVLECEDPKLQRRVAVKVLTPKGRRESASARARLVREAQALAQLNHPNVVEVLDVGLHDGRVFIAMELVDGQTLRRWMEGDVGQRPAHPWPMVVRIFEAAGRGLAAAHARGIVHRDFKPDNVMLGPGSGRGLRVRVMDFGLARSDELDSASAPSPSNPAATDSLPSRLTQTGALMGTPAYMAPEQFSGTFSEHSDQFAFCVTLFEALYGALPFAGRTAREHMVAVLDDERVEPAPRPGKPRVPGWLRAVIDRGLSPEPARRFADMDALLAALHAGGGRRRRRWALGLVGLAAAAGLGAVGVQRWSRAREAAACADAAVESPPPWGPARRDAVRAALSETGARYATGTIERVLPYVDAQAEAIARARAGVCRDAKVRDRMTDELYARATACLDERAGELDAAVTVLTSADAESIERAVAIVSNLRPVASCRDEARLARQPPPLDDPTAQGEILAMSWRADALTAAGEYPEALETASAALARAEATGHAPSIARVRTQVGHALVNLVEYRGAADTLEAAYFEASSHDAPEVAAEAALVLAELYAMHLGDLARAEEWGRHAEAAMALLDLPPDALLQAQLHEALGHLARERADFPRAQAEFERALAIREQTLGRTHPSLIVVLTNLGTIARNLGDNVAAAAAYARARRTAEVSLGPDHPRVAMVEMGTGAMYFDMGSYDEAQAAFESAVAIYERALGPNHRRISTALTNLALIYRARGDYDEAIRLTSRSIELLEGDDPDGADLAAPLDNLGLLYRTVGKREQSRAAHERSLEIREHVLGPDHPETATSLHNLGLVLKWNGDYDGAEKAHRRALEIFETAHGPMHHITAHPLAALATLELTRGRPEAALPWARRALEIRETADVAAEMRADSQFDLARALWDVPPDAGRDRDRARELALAAREVYAADDALTGPLAKVDAWLAAHP